MKQMLAVGSMLAGLVACSATSYGATCESLASLTLPDAKVTMAQPVAAGAFEAPGARELRRRHGRSAGVLPRGGDADTVRRL